MTMHGAYIYLSLFYFVYIFFLRITLLTGESNVNILIQTILSFKFYPNRHHLYTFLVIGKHHLLNLLLRFSQHRIQRIGRATVHFYILDKYQYFVFYNSKYRKTDNPFIRISRYLHSCIHHQTSISLHKYTFLYRKR